MSYFPRFKINNSRWLRQTWYWQSVTDNASHEWSGMSSFQRNCWRHFGGDNCFWTVRERSKRLNPVLYPVDISQALIHSYFWARETIVSKSKNKTRFDFRTNLIWKLIVKVCAELVVVVRIRISWPQNNVERLWIEFCSQNELGWRSFGL